MDADVAIVGAGPAGSALAILLGRLGVGCVLLDRATFPRDKQCGEGLMPAGVRVLERMGVGIDRLPVLRGVTYRVEGAGEAAGDFNPPAFGRGARRLAFDAALATSARDTPNVCARFGDGAVALERRGATWIVKTRSGEVTARVLVGADGLRSRVAHWLGWWRMPRPPHRYALVGHAGAPGHGVDRVMVTILEGREVYAAPTGRDELLVAVLGTKSGLRDSGEPAHAAYTRHVRAAHPGLDVSGATVRGAGPFWTRAARVSGDAAFLLGDAAGFLDPLTGDGMSDALVGAEKLAAIIASGASNAEAAYRRWEAGQWRRRWFVSRLARALTRSPARATRALRSLERRPSTLDRLLQVNDGSRGLLSLSAGDWATLAGAL